MIWSEFWTQLLQCILILSVQRLRWKTFWFITRSIITKRKEMRVIRKPLISPTRSFHTILILSCPADHACSLNTVSYTVSYSPLLDQTDSNVSKLVHHFDLWPLVQFWQIRQKNSPWLPRIWVLHFLGVIARLRLQITNLFSSFSISSKTL